MRRALAALGLFVLACGCGLPLASGAPPVEARLVGAQSQCRPAFPDQGGWSGGDVASSAVLPGGDGRSSVWIFGDSFVDRHAAASPSEASGASSLRALPAARRYPFAHHALAVSRCEADGTWRIEFATDRRFFEPDPTADWVLQVEHETGASPYYWPISVAAVGDALYVALLRVAPAPPRGPFALPFNLVGVDLARITDATRPPQAWTIAIAPLSSRGDLLPATSLVATRDHLYAFATLDLGEGGDERATSRSPRGLTRLPLDALAAWPQARQHTAAGGTSAQSTESARSAGDAGDAESVHPRDAREGAFELESKLEILLRDGSWQSRAEVARARILMADDASEMSVHYDPEHRAWLAVYSDPTREAGGGPADTVWLRAAARLEGPWSRPRALYRMPELARPDGPPPGEPFCYAAKAHPELAPAGRLLVTYVCNLFASRADEIPAVLERLRATPALYRPRVVELPVPALR